MDNVLDAEHEGAATTTLPAVTGIHHVGLTVCDVDRSEKWYGEVFGFQRVFVETHNEGTGFAVVMNRPGTPLFIGLDNHDTNEGEHFGEHRTGLDHLAIGVAERDDLDRWVEHFDRLGVAHSKINESSEPFPYATVIVRDPDNIQLELMWM
jgi:glyoxylase I family protein